MRKLLWRRFWDWFLEPMPFPRDHWYRPKVIVIWDEFYRDGDPATPESQAGEPVDSRFPPLIGSSLPVQACGTDK
jgi:hypothetical protein